MEETCRQPTIGYASEPRRHPKTKQIVRSSLLEMQVKSVLRWANEKQLPITTVLLEPLHPEHIPDIRSELELLLGNTNHRETADRIIYDGKRTLAILQADYEYANRLLGGLQDFLKGDPFILKKIAEQLPADDYWHKRITAYLASGMQREPIALAGFAQEYQPPAPAPLRVQPGRIKAFLGRFVSNLDESGPQPLVCTTDRESFYQSLIAGFEHCKYVLNNLDKEITRRSGSAQPASSREPSPVA